MRRIPIRATMAVVGVLLLVGGIAHPLGIRPAPLAPRPAPPAQRPVSSPWWSSAVVYEIYPRSFQDSDGDGVGDLKGIEQRLDYLERLGVDAIWLTPIYPSPQADFGYDISDFTAIDPIYGTLADFDHLVAAAGRRQIRVLMDLVLNHTSDQHPWFVESRASRTNPRREWYVWRDGKRAADGRVVPPNNWVNRIEQSPWEWDEQTRQYYYHYYDPRQPDLNWRNPQVEAAMLQAAKFWLDRGAAGFRLDAINTLFEAEDLADAPKLPGTNEYGEPSLSMVRQRNLPEVHDVLRSLRRFIDPFPGQPVLIGEIYTGSTKELAAWYGTPERPELQLPMNTNVGFLNKLDASEFRRLLAESDESFARALPLYVFDNHDRPRSWDRYGDGQHNDAVARMLAAILLGTRASALVYQGQEIGMVTATPTRKEDVRDPRGLAGWPREKGRDGERTPMQWNGSTGAGFTTSSRPWLPIPTTSATTNVAAEERDDASLLNWYRRLILLKRTDPVVHDGSMTLLDRDTQKVLAWVRTDRDESRRAAPVVFACNMSATATTIDIAAELRNLGYAPSVRRILLSSGGASLSPGARIVLPPFSTFVGRGVAGHWN